MERLATLAPCLDCGWAPRYISCYLLSEWLLATGDQETQGGEMVTHGEQFPMCGFGIPSQEIKDRITG